MDHLNIPDLYCSASCNTEQIHAGWSIWSRTTFCFATRWITLYIHTRNLNKFLTHFLASLLRWFQVTSSHVAHVPPVVHACETIESKNREIVQMLADPLDQPIQKLSLSLQVEYTQWP